MFLALSAPWLLTIIVEFPCHVCRSPSSPSCRLSLLSPSLVPCLLLLSMVGVLVLTNPVAMDDRNAVTWET